MDLDDPPAAHLLPLHDHRAALQRAALFGLPRHRALSSEIDISAVIPVLDDAPGLGPLLAGLARTLEGLGVTSEVLVPDCGRDARVRRAAMDAGASVIEAPAFGYGAALREAFARARGRFIITLDADLAEPPEFVRALWPHRHEADVVVASRYVRGGRATMPLVRRVLSSIFNRALAPALRLGVRDLSSAFRLYRAETVRAQAFAGQGFDAVPEILVRLVADGRRALEVPFHYTPRRDRRSMARPIAFGWTYLRTFWSLWRLRNSILSADYDARAFDSLIPLQRYWQRRRCRHVVELMAGQGRVLDVGCGSSRIIERLPAGSVALDILPRKLRHARRFGHALVCASAAVLPFADGEFPCVLCSQVIEHVPREAPVLDELCRVLAPGGRLILGTPDYARWEWVALEALYARVAPGAYADEHVTHYTRELLVDEFERRGFRLEATRYIARAELILAFRKPDGR